MYKSRSPSIGGPKFSAEGCFYIKSKKHARENSARHSRGTRACDPRTYESSQFSILTRLASIFNSN